MKRAILALLAGLALWAVVATLLNFGLRAELTGYAVVEPTMGYHIGEL